jgi:biotin carboxyl carrier protein
VSTYVALLDGGRREESLEVRLLEPGVYRVALRGRTHRVDAFQHDSGTLSLLIDTQSHSATIDRRGTRLEVRLRDSAFPVEILDERRLRMRRAAGKFTVEGRQTLVARLPGTVTRILKKPGEPVREGEGVLVVEAMGMENEVGSPKDGTVLEVLVQEGQAVEGRARLATVE